MNDTVPTTQPAADRCTLDWCTAARGHHGNHVRVIGLIEPTAWSTAAAVLVNVEAGPGEVDPLSVVGLVGKDGQRLSARLSWPEARALADLLEQAIEDHDPGAIVQRHGLVEVSTKHGWDDWQRALLRIGASGTLEMTGTAVVIEHNTGQNEVLRVHAPDGTAVTRVRGAVVAAAVALGVMR